MDTLAAGLSSVLVGKLSIDLSLLPREGKESCTSTLFHTESSRHSRQTSFSERNGHASCLMNESLLRWTEYMLLAIIILAWLSLVVGRGTPSRRKAQMALAILIPSAYETRRQDLFVREASGILTTLQHASSRFSSVRALTVETLERAFHRSQVCLMVGSLMSLLFALACSSLSAFNPLSIFTVVLAGFLLGRTGWSIAIDFAVVRKSQHDALTCNLSSASHWLSFVGGSDIDDLVSFSIYSFMVVALCRLSITSPRWEVHDQPAAAETPARAPGRSILERGAQYSLGWTCLCFINWMVAGYLTRGDVASVLAMSRIAMTASASVVLLFMTISTFLDQKMNCTGTVEAMEADETEEPNNGGRQYSFEILPEDQVDVYVEDLQIHPPPTTNTDVLGENDEPPGTPMVISEQEVVHHAHSRPGDYSSIRQPRFDDDSNRVIHKYPRRSTRSSNKSHQ